MGSTPHRVDDRPSIGRSVLQVAGFVLVVNVVGGAPGLLFGPGGDWFRSLETPWFYPPSIAFPIAWTTLFTLLGLALWLVWRADDGPRTGALSLFILQFALNVAWTPAFFGLESIAAGIVVLVPLWVLVLATTVAFARVDRRAGALLIPYLLWVTFALTLTVSLWRLNGL